MKIYRLLYDAMQFERQLITKLLELEKSELPAFSEEVAQAIKEEHKLRVSAVLQRYFRQAEASDLIDFYESYLGQKVLLMESHITPEITNIWIDISNKYRRRDRYWCCHRSGSDYIAFVSSPRHKR